jgi:predicted RNase H-like HicB family nuclease
MQVTIQFNATLPVKIAKRGRVFVASCPVLDVHSQGDTDTQARDHLGEALSLFFVSCFERGVLDDVLKEITRGWTPKTIPPAPLPSPSPSSPA